MSDNFFFSEFSVAKCHYTILKNNTGEVEASFESDTYAGFVDFLNTYIKSKSTTCKKKGVGQGGQGQGQGQGQSTSTPLHHFVCEQVANVDMIALLNCTLSKLLELPHSKNLRTIDNFRTEITNTQEPLEISVRQPFIVSADSKKVCSVDSASPLDPFRLKRNLKGKKIPNEKKNVDAQLFENKNQARHCLEESKNYFNYMSQPIQPVSMDLSGMMQATTQMPATRQLVFLLLCDPQTIFDSLPTNQSAETKPAATASSSKKLKTVIPVTASANDMRQSSYVKTVYHNICKKKKIFKTPSIGSIMFDGTSLVMSSARFINWFNSKTAATISN